jgi:hypothetical protein
MEPHRKNPLFTPSQSEKTTCRTPFKRQILNARLP